MISIPRGVDVLITKAAADPAFREILLAERDGAAAHIGLNLEPAEAELLRSIPRKQLEHIIGGTKVPPAARAAFAGYAAAAMIAAMGTVTVGCCHGCGGSRPIDAPPVETEKDKGGGAVEGTVRDDGGKPAGGARVTLEGTPYATIADGEGRYRLQGIPAGTYQINARSGGYFQLAPVEVTVVAGETAATDLTVRYISPPGGARPDIPKGGL